LPENRKSGRPYAPLRYCPTRLRARYGKAAEQAAGGSLIKAIKLKCLDCMGWEYAEAKQCDTLECPLWIFNHRAVPDHKARERSAA
jgi:hypothetical protein